MALDWPGRAERAKGRVEMLDDRIEGKWIDAFAAVFEHCKVQAGEAAAESTRGDAVETLNDLDVVDLLFLDGWNNLYVPLLERLEPTLSANALVVADLSADDPELGPYCERMHSPASGYVSVDIPLDAGVVVSVRA